MVIKVFSEMIKTIDRYKSFQECILTALEFKDGLTSVEFTIDFLYDVNGNFRAAPEPQMIKLKLNQTQLFKFNGDLSKSQLERPDLINWGLNEVSIVKIKDSSPLLDMCSSSPGFFHCEFLWESNRKIDVIFRSMEVS